MDPNAITPSAVLHALDAIRYQKPLEGNPLMGMAALSKRIWSQHVGDTPDSREEQLEDLLLATIWHQLTKLRPARLAAGDQTPEAELDELVKDFQTNNPDLQAWSWTFIRYLANGRPSVAEAASRVGRNPDNLRRTRLKQGTELLARALRDTEREALRNGDGPGTPPPDGKTVQWVQAEVSLTGRAREFSTLVSEWEKVRSKKPARAVLVAGEAGVGKTRLVQEFFNGQVTQQSEWLTFRAYNGNQRAPYVALAEALRPLVIRGTIPPIAKSALAEIAKWIPELEDLRPDLPPVPDVDTEQAHVRRQWAWSTYLLALAARAPTILLLDDLQWTDPATLSCVQSMLTVNPDKPLLVIGTYRTGGAPVPEPVAELVENLRRARVLTEIVLPPLDPEAISQILCKKVDRLKAPDFSDVLFDHTGGNPFYFLETFEMLHQRGEIAVDAEGDWVLLSSDEDMLATPATVAEMVSLRLQGLSRATTEFLKAAAVLGRDIEPDLAGEVAALDDDLVYEAVEELVRRRLIRTRPDSIVCDFAHGLLQEAVYQRLSPRDHRRLHRRAAEILEKRTGESPTILETQLLAQHSFEGGRWQEAFRYNLSAGQDALRFFDVPGARRFLETAESVARQRPITFSRDDRLACEEALGDIQRHMGALDEALAHYENARQLVADDPEKAADLARKNAIVLERQGSYHEAIDALKEARAQIDPEQHAAVFHRISMQFGMVYLRLGELDQAEIWAQRALPSGLAQANNLMAMVKRAKHDLPEAHDYCMKCIEIAEEQNDPINRAKGYTNLSVVLFEQDRWEEAMQANQTARQAQRDLGDAYMHALSICNRSDIHRHLGNVQKALDLAVEGLEKLERIESKFGMALAHFNLGAALLARGEAAAARGQHLEVARDQLTGIDAKDLLAGVERTLAEALIELGELGEAAEAAKRALVVADEIDSMPDRGSGLRVLGRVYHARGDLDKAEKTLDESVSVLEKHGPRFELGRAHFALAELLGLSGRDADGARKALDQARGVFDELSAKQQSREVRELAGRL